MPTAPAIVRTIHVGVGGRGATHLANVAADPRFKPVAGVDVVPAHLDAAVEHFRVPRQACFPRLGDALRSVDADAVVISTPVSLHGEQIEEALAADKHVMVEKPFTIDLRQAERIVRTAEDRGLKVMVTQNARYIPAIRTMARLVRERAHGAAGYFNLQFHKVRPRPYNNSPHQQLWQMSVHDLDALRSVIPGEPRRVFCAQTRPPWTAYPTAPAVMASLEFGGTGGEPAIPGVYLGSSDSKGRSFELRVECAEGGLVIRGYAGPLLLARGAEEQPLPLDALPNQLTHDQLMSHLFYEYVVNGVEPDISGHNNLGTMRLMDACVRSLESGQVAEV